MYITYIKSLWQVSCISPAGELKLSVDISKYTETAKSAGAAGTQPEIPAGGPLPIIPVVVVVGVALVAVLVFAAARRRGRV